MDRNQIIGIVIMVVIFVGFAWYSMPNEQEKQAILKKRDSLILIQKNRKIADSIATIARINAEKETELIAKKDTLTNDSVVNTARSEKYGVFANTIKGEDHTYTLKNKLITIKINARGGYMYSAQLNNYKTYDSLPVMLFDSADAKLSMNIFAGNKKIVTNDMFFVPEIVQDVYNADTQKASVAMRLKANNGGYVEYKYTLEPNSYLLKFDVNIVSLENVIAANRNDIDVTWESKALRHEKGASWENQNTTIYYKVYKDDTDYLGESSDDKEEDIPTKVKWIAYKNQFFSQILIPDTYIERTLISYEKDQAQADYLKNFKSIFAIPYNHTANERFGFTYYIGPNQYKGLSNISISEGDDLDLEAVVPLGWGIFGWVNRFAIVPMFNLFDSWNISYGLLILLMTVIIKSVLFPLTYKSYKSSAKMRVLKPQIEELNKKHEKSDAMKKQQATQELYKRAGVNPLGGCLPMLLQMPILFAMFRFFPASIELRHQSFLWATDLSSYDSIWDFPAGFSIPMYGDHVSLFTLLMAAGILISTKLNGNQMETGGGANNPLGGMNMKLMTYLMPLVMILWFNNYSAGLSYYYFLSNLITIGQTLIIRNMVNEEELLATLNKRKAKNIKPKKTKLQARLDAMQKQGNQYKLKKNNKSKRK